MRVCSITCLSLELESRVRIAMKDLAWDSSQWKEKPPFYQQNVKEKGQAMSILEALNPLFLKQAYFPYFVTQQLSFSFSQFSSVQSFSRVRLSATPWIAAHQASCPSPTSGVYSNSCPSSQCCHPAISSSVVPFYSCPQSLPTSGSFPMSQLFRWGGQSMGLSASASVLAMNTQDWSPSGWTGWISLQSKGLTRVFFNTIVQKHQLFGSQLSSQSNSHIHIWSLEKP